MIIIELFTFFPTIIEYKIQPPINCKIIKQVIDIPKISWV